MSQLWQSDVMVEPVVKYGEMMEAHARSNALATVCLALWQTQIEFGVATIEDDRLIGIREKPIESFLVNAGIYVLEPNAMAHAPKGSFDMTDLLERLDGLGHFAIQGQWHDVGTFEDLRRANGEG